MAAKNPRWPPDNLQNYKYLREYLEFYIHQREYIKGYHILHLVCKLHKYPTKTERVMALEKLQ